MLVTIAISPDCFEPKAISDVESRVGAERALQALLANATVISTVNDFAATIRDGIGGLGSRYGQQLGILVGELIKSPNRPVPPSPGILATGDPSLALVVAARERKADLVVCSSPEQVAIVGPRLPADCEVCLWAGYTHTNTERLRTVWLSAQELSNLDEVECDNLVGRAVRDTRFITIADRMFGRAAKEGRVTGQLEAFAKGVVYLADVWSRIGTHASGAKPEIEIVTVAGVGGAGDGHIDPAIAEPAIRRAIEMVDQYDYVGNLNITFKSDSSPPVFRDRFICTGPRCWGIRHGLDDIGKLYEPAKKRSPTVIDPDSSANRIVLSKIRALKSP